MNASPLSPSLEVLPPLYFPVTSAVPELPELSSESDSSDDESSSEIEEASGVAPRRNPPRRGKRKYYGERESFDALDDPFDHDYRSKTSSSLVSSIQKKHLKTSGPAISSIEVLTNYSDLPAEHYIGNQSTIESILDKLATRKPGLLPLLLAPKGTGRSSLVKHIAQCINRGEGHSSLHGSEIICIDCTKLVGQKINYLGEEDENLGIRLRQYMESLKHFKKPIVYFKDFERLLEIEPVPSYLASIYRSSIPWIASSSVSQIEGTETSKYQDANELLTHLFKAIPIKECDQKQSYEIIQGRLKKWSLQDRVIVSDKACHLASALAVKHLNKLPLPTSAWNVIAEAAQLALRESASSSSSTYKAVKRKKSKHTRLQAISTSPKVTVTIDHIARIIAPDAGIPAKVLTTSTLERLEQMRKSLLEKLPGQSEAVEIMFQRIKRSKLGRLQNQPLSAALFAGPSGVGKTELAKLMASHLFDGPQNFLKIECNLFYDDHVVSSLIGASRSYVGHGDPGTLAKQLLDYPDSVILFDEVEKAPSKVLHLLFSIFAEGEFRDQGTDKLIDCRRAYFILTSNLGSEEIAKLIHEGGASSKKTKDIVLEAFRKYYSSALLGRLQDVIPFKSIDKKDYPSVIEVHLNYAKEQLAKSRGIELSWTKAAVKYLTTVPFDTSLGARKLRDAVNDCLDQILLGFPLSKSGPLCIDCVKNKLIAK